MPCRVTPCTTDSEGPLKARLARVYGRPTPGTNYCGFASSDFSSHRRPTVGSVGTKSVPVSLPSHAANPIRFTRDDPEKTERSCAEPALSCPCVFAILEGAARCGGNLSDCDCWARRSREGASPDEGRSSQPRRPAARRGSRQGDAVRTHDVRFHRRLGYNLSRRSVPTVPAWGNASFR